MSELPCPGESVEENANLVIRLLIRRPECLGPALRGEGEGLLNAINQANKVRIVAISSLPFLVGYNLATNWVNS